MSERMDKIRKFVGGLKFGIEDRQIPNSDILKSKVDFFVNNAIDKKASDRDVYFFLNALMRSLPTELGTYITPEMIQEVRDIVRELEKELGLTPDAANPGSEQDS